LQKSLERLPETEGRIVVAGIFFALTGLLLLLLLSANIRFAVLILSVLSGASFMAFFTSWFAWDTEKERNTCLNDLINAYTRNWR